MNNYAKVQAQKAKVPATNQRTGQEGPTQAKKAQHRPKRPNTGQYGQKGQMSQHGTAHAPKA